MRVAVTAEILARGPWAPGDVEIAWLPDPFEPEPAASAEADRILRERKARELMLAGVTIERPETVTIDAGVAVGQDTVIEPFARLLGQTHIGEDCHIGAGSLI